MIGIIGAMDVEIDLLKSLLENKTVENISGIDFVCGTLYGKEVVAARCGIGKVNAAICAQTMILKYAPKAVINIGVGGSLSNSLDIGDIAMAEYMVQSDVDTSPLGDPVGFISTVNILQIPCDKAVLSSLGAAAEKLGMNFVRGVISTSDAFIADGAKKEWLNETFGAIACEMEGGSIGQVCYVNKVPFCVIRAISDKADGSSHTDYGDFCALAAKNSSSLICEYVKNM